MPQLKRAMAIFVITASICTCCGQTTKAIEVTFPDAAMEAAVRANLGIQTEPITDYDMEYLIALEVPSSNISSLTGLDYATNLCYLDMRENNIGNTIPLAKLTNLNHLDLAHNHIVNFFPLAGMTGLNYLNLADNSINSLTIPPLNEMTNLFYLNLSGNHISDPASFVWPENLTDLSLSHNEIHDMSFIAGLPNLRNLNLSSNYIYEIATPYWIVPLERLDLSFNDIHDITPLANLESEILHLEYNDISDISTVAGMQGLKELYLQSNNIDDVAPLAQLNHLHTLKLECNDIETMNLSDSCLSSLQNFRIDCNPITKVLLVNAILSQETFSVLMEGGPSYYKGIADLDGVLSLDMSGVDFTEISDLSVLNTMDDLEELFLTEATNLNGSSVVTLTTELDSLNWLDVTGLWDNFDTAAQESLYTWDAIEGHSLITEFVAGDANGDGRVDGSDVTILAGNWQYGVDDGQFATRAMGDFNGDGQIDGSDVTILAGNWQYGANSTATAVPEPATLIMLLALIGLAIVIRKRQ